MPAAAQRDTSRAQRPPSRSRLILPLIVGPLLCVIALTGLAYVGLAQQARRDSLAQVGVAAQAAHGALMASMGAIKVTNGQLTSALPATVMALNNNNAEAQRLHAQVGVDTLIAQREQGALVVIASSLSGSHTGAAPAGLGERLNGAFAASACAPEPATTTSGSLTLMGVEYLAGSAPLLDGSGACVGAIFTLTPVQAIQTGPLEYTVILAMTGALLTLLTVAVGLALSGRAGAAALVAQNERLRVALASLTQAESACATQLAQREWMDRRLATGQQRLRQMLDTLAQDRLALQDTTSDMWAGVSHPGAPIDPATAMRLARETAVVAARVGSRLNDFDAVTDELLADLSTAEEVDAMLGDALQQTTTAMSALRALTDVTQPDAQPAQRHATSRQSAISPDGTSRQSGGYRAMRGDSSQRRAVEYRGSSGSHRQPGAAGSSGRHPRAPQPPQKRPPDGRERDASDSRWLND